MQCYVHLEKLQKYLPLKTIQYILIKFDDHIWVYRLPITKFEVSVVKTVLMKSG